MFLKKHQKESPQHAGLCKKLGDSHRVTETGALNVMLHETIRNDDFKRNTALRCRSDVVTIRNNVATMLQGCVALKIVVANGLV